MYTCDLKFPDGSVASFQVDPPSRETLATITRQCLRPGRSVADSVTLPMDRVVFAQKWERMVILSAVKGWSGFRNKHLPVIFNRAKEWRPFGDKQEETEIPFTLDARRELADMHSDFFGNWLDHTMTVIRSEREHGLSGGGAVRIRSTE